MEWSFSSLNLCWSPLDLTTCKHNSFYHRICFYTTFEKYHWVLIAWFNNCELVFSSYIANLINAFDACGEATHLNLSTRVWLEQHVGGLSIECSTRSVVV